MTENPEHNPLWSYSTGVYEREGVAPLCLELQDRFGCDVNLLLYGGWLASRGLALTSGHLACIEAGVAEWRRRVVHPLRVLRRDLRDFAPADSMRAQIKALELDAERLQQDEMYRLYEQAVPLPPGEDATQANLALVLRQQVANIAAGRTQSALSDGLVQVRNLAQLIAV